MWTLILIVNFVTFKALTVLAWRYFHIFSLILSVPVDDIMVTTFQTTPLNVCKPLEVTRLMASKNSIHQSVNHSGHLFSEYVIALHTKNITIVMA